MDFSHRTYLVLEMPPSEWVDQVQKFRKKYEPWRRNLPVEVTIIGSRLLAGQVGLEPTTAALTVRSSTS